KKKDTTKKKYSVVLLGCLVAFLRFNFEPAEIFMGDAGSCFLGFFLGSLAVSANYLVDAQFQHLPILTPLLIFAVPLYDTFSVMAIRLIKGHPIWQADNRHFSHRLVALGLTRRSAVLLIYLITFTSGILAVLLPRLNRTDALLLLVHGAAIFAIILLLEYASAARENTAVD
ncbi:MAG: MraY family glycosyltransferase, partial [bacterium]